MHGGTPNSRCLYPPHLELAAKQRVRLLSYDRPGYGGSTPHPGRSVAHCAEDVRAIADALGIDRLAIWGISGGGPHALACAALLPERVVAVASLASLAPFDAEGLDYFRGMGELNVEDIKLMLRDVPSAKAKTVKDREQLIHGDAESTRKFMDSLLTPTDAAVLTGDLAEYLVLTGKQGLAPGIEGWWGDGWAFIQPWGFELDAIRIPVMVWHGRHDQFVPFQHGEWLASHIPGVEAHLSDDDGHLTLLQRRIPEVHEWLLRHF